MQSLMMLPDPRAYSPFLPNRIIPVPIIGAIFLLYKNMIQK